MTCRSVFSPLLLAAALVLAPAAVQADFQGPSSDAGTQSMTVAQALSSKMDKDNVCLTGNVVSSVATDAEKYRFSDGTGTIIVEIDAKVFQGQHVTPTTKVRICGDVDVEFTRPNEFDAESLRILP